MAGSTAFWTSEPAQNKDGAAVVCLRVMVLCRVLRCTLYELFCDFGAWSTFARGARNEVGWLLALLSIRSF